MTRSVWLRHLPDWVLGSVDQGHGAFGEVAAVAHLPFVVGLDADRAGQPERAAGLGKTPTTSVRRLISLFSRSSGLVDHTFDQCERGSR
jgi:hypothetical protein